MKKILALLLLALVSVSLEAQAQNQPWPGMRQTKGPGDLTLWISPPPGYQSVPMNYYMQPAKGLLWLNENADDFDVPYGETWVVTSVGIAMELDQAATVNAVDVAFYQTNQPADIGFFPETNPLSRQHCTAFFIYDVGPYMILEVTLIQPVNLAGGAKYWISLGGLITPPGQGLLTWYNSYGIPEAPSFDAPFVARTTPSETNWANGAYYYDQYEDQLAFYIMGTYPEIPLKGWIIPVLFGLIAVTVVFRKRIS